MGGLGAAQSKPQPCVTQRAVDTARSRQAVIQAEKGRLDGREAVQCKT
jgi:hypothetical protein